MKFSQNLNWVEQTILIKKISVFDLVIGPGSSCFEDPYYLVILIFNNILFIFFSKKWLCILKLNVIISFLRPGLGGVERFPVKKNMPAFCEFYALMSVTSCNNFLMSGWIRIYYRKLQENMTNMRLIQDLRRTE